MRNEEIVSRERQQNSSHAYAANKGCILSWYVVRDVQPPS
jgi:hypothetical protein